MSAPNFKTMMDFPLIVADYQYCKICPECGCGQDPENEKCECCDADLTEVEERVDEILCQETTNEMEKVAARLNEVQPFFKVTVESGYYCGVQFFVENKNDPVEDMENDDTNYYYGMCRSKAMRKEKAAGNLIRRELRKAKDELGLIELACLGIFSNGEAVYEKVA